MRLFFLCVRVLATHAQVHGDFQLKKQPPQDHPDIPADLLEEYGQSTVAGWDTPLLLCGPSGFDLAPVGLLVRLCSPK